MCIEINYKGLIILIDEFEDVIYNLNNIRYQQSAFWNLFKFFSGDVYNNITFFAVTPGFVNKCKEVLLNKEIYHYDYSRFDSLPSFEMEPLNKEQLKQLSKKIANVHFIAYNWKPDKETIYSQLEDICEESALIKVQDRVRQTIISIVRSLDQLMEEYE